MCNSYVGPSRSRAETRAPATCLIGECFAPSRPGRLCRKDLSHDLPQQRLFIYEGSTSASHRLSRSVVKDLGYSLRRGDGSPYEG